MGKGKVSGKAIRDAFFTPHGTEKDVWVCKCKKERKQTSSGYTNLVQHVASAHPDEYRTVLNDELNTSSLRSTPLSTSTTSKFLYSQKTTRVFGWLDLTINGLMSFRTCENEQISRHVKYLPISVKTLRHYMSRLTRVVENKIRSRLPKYFALVFDGWTSKDTHYLGVFATFPDSNSNGYSKFLLAFSPFEDETSQNSDQHYEFVTFILGVFSKSLENVAFARKAGKPLIGCASRRMNLAVQKILSVHVDVIDQVRDIMKRLRFPVPAAKLRRLTPLKSVLSNATKWSSTFNMLNRYLKLHEILPEIDIPEIQALLPNTRDHNKIADLCKKLEDLDTVTKALQRDSITLVAVRALFDETIKLYPTTAEYLSPDSKIVKFPFFESALCKIQDKNGKDLSADEESAVSFLEKETEVVQPSDRNLSIAERALKKVRLSNNNLDRFVDTRYLLPTSNICERLFSSAKNTLQGNRFGLSPTSFEEQLFLCMNKHTWGVDDVNTLVVNNANEDDS